jgi:transposase
MSQCIGIDIAKAKFDFAVVNGATVALRGQGANTEEGIRTWLQKLETHGIPKSTPCVLESTGIYHVPVSLMLRDSGYTVNCINPIITKTYQRASVRGSKTDTIDAERLAHIGLRETQLPIFSATKESLYANRLVSLMARLEKLKQSYTLALNTLRESERMLGIPPSTLGDDLRKQFAKTLAILRAEVQARAPLEAHVLAEIPGISAHAAAVLMTHLSGKRFAHRDQLVAYIGLDIRVIQSGTFRGRGKLSKRGNSYMRKILHQIAWGLKQHNPFYQEFFARLRADKRPYKEALTIIARKFLRYVHGKYLCFPQQGI